MASCNKCKKPVGCGCNLNRDGICATCANAEKNKNKTLIGNTNPPKE